MDESKVLNNNMKTEINDVADRRETEETLRKTTAFAESIIYYMKDGFSALDNKGVHINVNKSLCEMTGFSKEELIGSGTPHPYWPPEEYRNIEKIFQKTFQGQFDNFELTFMRKNGERFPVIVSPSWIKDEKGNVTSCFATIKDITERKRAEKEIISLSKFPSENPNPVLRIAEDGTILYSNKGGLELLANWGAEIGEKAPERWCRLIKKKFDSGKTGSEEEEEEEEEEGKTLSIMIVPVRNDGYANLYARNITERKKAEEELKIKKVAMDGAMSAIAITDMEGRHIYANKALMKMFKFKDTSEILGKKALDLVRNKDVALNVIKAVQKNGEWLGEIYHIRKDGTAFPVLLSANLIKDEDNNPGYMIGSYIDITERKKAEEEIKNLAKFPEENANPVYRVSKDGVLLYANIASRRLVLEDQTKIGNKVPEKWIGMLKNVYDSGKKQEVELELSGRIFLFVQVPVIEGGYINSYAIDITERKSAEDELKEIGERLELALSSANMGTWRWNIKTDQDTRDASFNHILGLKAVESTQSVKDFVQHVHPDDRAAVDEKIKRAIREHDIYSMEFRIVMSDGSIRWLSDRGKVYYDQKNEPAYMTGAAFDITERKLAEEALRETSSALRERVKELSCLYGLTGLVEKPNVTLDEIFQGMVRLIPPAWQYPETTCARIIFEGKEFKTKNFREVEWKQSADIIVWAKKAGIVEAGYLEEKSDIDKGPFLKEERQLLNAIAERLGRIIERKSVEEVLKKKETFNKALFDYNPIETIIVDSEGRITMVNLAKKRSGDRLPNIGDVMYKDYADKHDIDMYKQLRKCVRNGKVKEFSELKYGDKYLAITISPFPGGAIITSRDITDHKRAEEAVERKLEFETAIYDISSRFVTVSSFLTGSPDMDNAIDESLKEMGGLSDASRTYVFLIEKDGVLINNTHEWCRKGVRPQIDNLQSLSCSDFPWWMKKLKKGEIIQIEDVSQMPPEAKAEKAMLEKQAIKSLLILPLKVEGDPAGFIGFDNVMHTGKWSNDDLMLLRISSEIIGNALERRRAEELVEGEQKKREKLIVELDIAYKKLQSAQQELVRREKIATTGALAAGVAHEIRNPLAIIGMTVQYLQSKLNEKDPKRELTEAIISKVERLDRVTREISSYGRTAELNIRKCNIAKCLNLNLALVKPKCRVRKIKIVKKYAWLPKIKIDEEQIDKVFLNILDNAIDAMDVKGGVLTLALTFNNKSKRIVIKLHNTGPAIKKKDISHIFEPFYTAKKKKGTGLGLAIVQNVVSRHGGQISVQSKRSGEGKGVTFIISLPLTPPRAEKLERL